MFHGCSIVRLSLKGRPVREKDRAVIATPPSRRPQFAGRAQTVISCRSDSSELDSRDENEVRGSGRSFRSDGAKRSLPVGFAQSVAAIKAAELPVHSASALDDRSRRAAEFRVSMGVVSGVGCGIVTTLFCVVAVSSVSLGKQSSG